MYHKRKTYENICHTNHSLGPDSIQRRRLTSIGNPIVEIRRSLAISVMEGQGERSRRKVRDIHMEKIEGDFTDI